MGAMEALAPQYIYKLKVTLNVWRLQSKAPSHAYMLVGHFSLQSSAVTRYPPPLVVLIKNYLKWQREIQLAICIVERIARGVAF